MLIIPGVITADAPPIDPIDMHPPTPPLGDDPPIPEDGVQDEKKDNGTKFKISNITKNKIINLLHNTWSYDNNLTEVQVNVTGDRVQLLINNIDTGEVTLDMNFSYGEGNKTFNKTKDKEKISYKTKDLNITYSANTSDFKEIIVVDKEKDKLFPLNWTVTVTSEENLPITRIKGTIYVCGVKIFTIHPFTATNVTNGTVALNETYTSGASSFNISLDLGNTIDKDEYPLTIDPTVSISPTGGNWDNNARTIAVDSSGVMYIAYYDGTNLEYQKSTDGGKTWGTTLNIETEINVRDVGMCVDSNDNRHFFWKADDIGTHHKSYWVGNSTWSPRTTALNNGGNWHTSVPDDSGNVHLIMGDLNGGANEELVHRMWDGDSWGSETQIRDDLNGAGNLRVNGVIDTSGDLHIVWQGYDAASTWTVYYSTSSTGGTSWSGPLQIDDNLGRAHQPSIAIDSSDDLHIIWQGRNATHNQDQAVYRKYSGSWGTVSYLTDSTDIPHVQPTMATDRKGPNIYAIWSDDNGDASNYQIVMRKSEDQGSTWNSEIQLIDRTASSRIPIALHYNYPEDCGNVPYWGVMFSFTEDWGGTPTRDIYYSSDFLLNKTNPSWVDDSTVATQAAARTVARTPDGKLHLLAYDTSRVRHYYSDDDGYTWTAGTLLGPGISYYPGSLAALSNGDLYAAIRGSSVNYWHKYTNATSSWSAATSLGSGNAACNAVDSQDRVFYFTGYSTTDDLNYRYWDGDAWVTHSTWETDGRHPDVIVDRFDRVHVVWCPTVGNDGLVYQINDQNGLNTVWSDEEIIVAQGGAGNAMHPKIVVDTNGDPHVVWQYSAPNYEIWYANRIGGTWSTPVKLSHGSGGNTNYLATISLDRNDTIHVAWQGYHVGSSAIYQIRNVTSHDLGTTWETVNNLTAASGHQYYPYMMSSYWAASNLSRPTKGYAMYYYDTVDDDHLYYRSPDYSHNPGYLRELNDPPFISAVTPPDGDDTIRPTGSQWLSATVAEPEGQTFDLTWYKSDAVSGPWTQIGTNTTCSNGTYWREYTGVTSKETDYFWRVLAVDSEDLGFNHTYSFTTVRNWDHVINGTGQTMFEGRYYYTPTQQPMDAGGRQMNGILWYFAVFQPPSPNQADAYLVGYYSTDNGTTWTNQTIWSYTDPGFETGGFPYRVYDCQILSNNSIILLVKAYYWETAASHDVMLLCHWNNSDLTQWEKVTIQTHTSYTSIPMAITANSTDKMLVVYQYRGDRTYSVHWNPSNRTKSNEGVKYPAGLMANGQAWAVVNSTDDFEILTSRNDGVGMDFYAYKGDGTWTKLYNSGDDGPGGVSGDVWDAAILPDGTYIWTEGLGWNYYCYWNSTGYGRRRFATDYPFYTTKLGLTNSSRIWFTAYSRNFDQIFLWKAENYYDNNETLQSWRTPIWEEQDDEEYIYAKFMPTDLFPQTTDPFTLQTNYTQLTMPDYFYLSIVEFDVDPPDGDGDNNYDYWLMQSNDTAWPGIAYWTYIPSEGGGGEPPNGNGGGNNNGGGGGGMIINPQVTFNYKKTLWGIKFIPVYPTKYQVVSYKWLFGDGSSSARSEPTHWYRDPGEYVVTIEVKFSNGVISRNSQIIIVDEISDIQYLFHMVERDDDRIYIRFGYYELIFTELSLVISGILAFVAVTVSLHDRKKYNKRIKESTATVVLRTAAILWVCIATILLIWIKMGGI